MEINLAWALLLTGLAGLSTAIGSVIAYFIRRPNYSFLAVMLGFSAGVMIYVSFAELLRGAIDDIGFAKANIGFFSGIAFIAVIDLLVPHEYQEERAEGLKPFAKGQAQLKPENIAQSSSPSASNQSSFAGRAANFGRRLRFRRRAQRRALSPLMRAGVFVALGVAIHNLPEGLVTFSTVATGGIALGTAVAVAIAIHNIPEGIAMSVPIFYATGSRRRAFIYSSLSGLAEPLGAIIGYAILLPFLTSAILSGLMAFVAGIMVYISLDELLPLAHKYGQEHLAIIGIGSGMLVMAVSLFLLV